MKKILFVLFSVIVTVSAQEQTKEKAPKNYNRLAFELNVGQNKPGETFNPGYYTADPDTYMNFNRLGHYAFGVRYMINNKFGIKLDGAFDKIAPEKGNGSFDFESRQIRVGFQGIVNVRNLLNFDSWTKRFGLLGHAGIQVSYFDPIFRNLDYNDSSRQDLDGLNEDNGGFIFGLTPQYRLTSRLILNLDVSFLVNTRAHLTWDGTPNTVGDFTNNLNSSMVNTSLGLTYFIGKHQISADFAPDEINNKFDDLDNKLAQLEKELKDAQEAKDNEDQNNNGIPDNVENYIKEQLANYKAENNNTVETTDLVRKMINDGYICGYFDFDKRTPTLFSSDNIDFVRTYLLKNPNSNVKVTGFADVIGNEEYNNKLGLDRANSVKDILIKAGIDGNRISTVSAGEDDSVDKDSDFARRMVRRVLFTVD